MSNFNDNQTQSLRIILYRALLVIVTVAIIVLFLPRSGRQQLRYEIGKPWIYGQFIAKFDFPIYKTDEAMQHERDSIMQMFQPYYNINANVEKENVKAFLANYKDGIPGLPKQYVPLVADRLHRLYTAGIMGQKDYSTLSRDTTRMVRLVSGKQAITQQINCIYSTKGAYEQLFDDPLLAAKRQILQRCNLNDYIEPNLIYDSDRSETEKNDLLSGIPLASGMVMQGQKIIDRGEIVNDYDYRVLNSFEKEMARRNANNTENVEVLIGQILFVVILVTLFTLYLNLFRKDYFDKPRSIAMLYVMITAFPILVSLMMSHNVFSVYIIPFAIAPIFIRMFMDSRTAFITHVTMILICAAAVRYQYEFIIIQLVAGLTAIYTLRELTKRSQIFVTAIVVTVATAVTYFALQLMQNNDFSTMDSSMYVHFAINGCFLLFAYPMMLLVEKTFGFTSTITLFELSNTNSPLLRRLSQVAPGTFQHSIMVGNLASECANKIEGAKSQLVRTGALYHDIGKMENPVYFTENQSGVNPHDNLPEKESARIIIAHVTDGLKLADKFNLPPVIKGFIATHHGTGLVKYFFIKYKNAHPDEEVDESLFRYPGPNPRTIEEALLMMCDTIEAASRSMKEYTEKNISELVNKLIDRQVAEGFFNDCPITFRDISIAKHVLIEQLKSIYHTRIQYPKLSPEAEKNLIEEEKSKEEQSQ